MPMVRILSGSQAGGIVEQSQVEAEINVATGFVELVEAVDGQWQKVAGPSAQAARAPEGGASTPSKAPKPAVKPQGRPKK